MVDPLARAFEEASRLPEAEQVDLARSSQSVEMPIEECQQMLEDIRDLVLIAERSDEPTEPLDAVLERLRKDGGNTSWTRL